MNLLPPSVQRENVKLETDRNESADRLTSLLAQQADMFGALLVAIRSIAPPKTMIISRREDAANTTNGLAFTYALQMRENADIKSIYLENSTGSTLYVFPGVAQAGVPILTVNSGTFRRTPIPAGIKEVTITGTGSGGPNTAPLLAIITTQAWEPVIGSIV